MNTTQVEFQSCGATSIEVLRSFTEIQFGNGNNTLIEFEEPQQSIALASPIISIEPSGELQLDIEIGASSSTLVESAVTGPRGLPGPIGPPGIPGSEVFSALASQDMPAGTPVYVNRADKKLYPADRANSLSSLVVGLLVEDASANFMASYSRADVALDDWSAIAGAPSLQLGQLYFLGNAGTITTAVPQAPGTCTRIGEAIDENTLALSPSIVPILL